MPLDFLVREARKTSNFKTYNPSLSNFIDTTSGDGVKRLNLIKRSSGSAAEDIPWNKCKHLKAVNGTDHCQKYLSYCAKEKCKPQWKD